MPAYMCDTVFIPFVRMGWELIFYHIDKDMKIQEEEFRSLIDEHKPGMIFIHPYYGVDTWKEFRPLLAQYQNAGLILMEDVTQSYYLNTSLNIDKGAEKHASCADYIVGSLRKWYAIPDGGFVTTNRLLYADSVNREYSFAEKRLEMQIKKWTYLHELNKTKIIREKQGEESILSQSIKDKKEYLEENKRLENELDHYTAITGMSDISKRLLLTVDEKEVQMNRNLNYRLLNKELQNAQAFRPVFLHCEKDAAPLYFPIYAKDREGVQMCLKEHDIYAPVLWPIGSENAECLNTHEKYIYSHLLAIPMDQRYGTDEMERIIEVLDKYDKDFYL